MSTVDPLDPTKPVYSDKVKQLVDELQALKSSINARLAVINSELDAGALTSLRVPSNEAIGEFPAASLRINKVVMFGATGQPVLINLGQVSGLPSLIPEDGSITTAKFAVGAKAPFAVVADSAASAASVSWIGVTGTPVTFAGYGIPDVNLVRTSDAVSGNELPRKSQVDAAVANIPSNLKSFARFPAGGASPALDSNLNVSSITKLATGYYKVTFTAPLVDGNYAVVASASTTGGHPAIVHPFSDNAGSPVAPLAGEFVLYIEQPGFGAVDASQVMFAVYR